MIDEWQGTVYCEKWLNASGRNFQAAIWGDCCLQAGPYLFFGDRTILAEIHLALQAPSPCGPGFAPARTPHVV